MSPDRRRDVGVSWVGRGLTAGVFVLAGVVVAPVLLMVIVMTGLGPQTCRVARVATP